MWALVAPLAKRFLRQSHSTPFWNAFPSDSVYLFFSAKILCRTHLLKKSVLHINTMTWVIFFFECLNLTYVLGETLPRFLGTCFFWGGAQHVPYRPPSALSPYGTRTRTYLVMNQMFQCGRQHRQFVKPKTLILWEIRNHQMGYVRSWMPSWMVDLNLTPLKINGWNMSSLRWNIIRPHGGLVQIIFLSE